MPKQWGHIKKIHGDRLLWTAENIIICRYHHLGISCCLEISSSGYVIIPDLFTSVFTEDCIFWRLHPLEIASSGDIITWRYHYWRCLRHHCWQYHRLEISSSEDIIFWDIVVWDVIIWICHRRRCDPLQKNHYLEISFSEIVSSAVSVSDDIRSATATSHSIIRQYHQWQIATLHHLDIASSEMAADIIIIILWRHHWDIIRWLSLSGQTIGWRYFPLDFII